jgi:hypothetical protein
VDLCVRHVDSRASWSAGGVVVVEVALGGIKVLQLILHCGDAPHGDVGEREVVSAQGIGGSMGLGFLGGWRDGGVDPCVKFFPLAPTSPWSC